MLCFLLVACQSPEPFPVDGDRPSPQLDALDDAFAEAQDEVLAPGAQAAVWMEDGRWSGALGWADVEAEEPVRTDHVFRMASVTKMFVGALAAELHAEGTLDLDAPAAQLVPTAPHGDAYTLRQALQHVTGLPDYVSTPDLLFGMNQPWEPEELLALVDDDPLAFEPGSAYAYSNSNYIVAGLAIEAATGRPWQAQVRERFVDPLSLQRVTFPTEEPLHGERVRGYVGEGDDPSLADDVDPSIAWAVGELMADSADLAAATRSLVRGDTLSEEAHAAWLEEGVLSDGSGTGYGLGVELYEDRVGHSGSILGFQSRVYVARDGSLTVAAAANSFTVEADGLAEPLWDAAR